MVEPGPFATSFFDNLLPGSDSAAAADYGHVAAFGEGFKAQVVGAFEDPSAPTDPALVIDVIEELMSMPAGTRPLRNVAGLDFGARAVNDAVEPLRKQLLADVQISEWDGPQSGA